MDNFFALTITGLSLASIYAITASGLTLTYTTTRIFNFAHGAIGMIVAFCFWEVRFGLGWPPAVAWIVCIAVIAPVLGVALERVLIRPLEGAAEVTRLVITVALMLFLVALAQTLWNPTTFRVAQETFAGEGFTVASVRITYNELVDLGIAGLVAATLWVLLYRTRLGVTMRAAVDNPTLTRLSGVKPARVGQIAWISSVMLAGLGGILIAPYVTLTPLPLTLVILDAYAAAVIGRLRSLPMTFLGATVLGLLVSYATGYIEPTGNQYLLGLVAAVPALILFAALLALKPSRLTQLDLSTVRRVLRPSWRGGTGIALASIVGTAGLVVILSPGDLLTSTQIWGLAIVALSLVPLLGYARRVSLCQLTFAGVGAVVVAHAGATVPALALAGVVAGALGALVAALTIRLSGIYMALSTAAVALVFDEWIFPLPKFALFGHPFDLFEGGSLSVDRMSVFGLRVGSSTRALFFGAITFSLMVAVVVAVRRSRFGERVIATSDSEQAAASIGISNRANILAVFSLSAAMAGVGGAVYAIGIGSLPANAFQMTAGLPILLFMVIGGVDSLGAAALCGAFVGGPFLTDLVPGVSQLTALLVAGPAILLVRHPDGVMVRVREQFADRRTARRRLGLLGGAVIGVWLLAALEVITTREWIALTFVGLPALVGLPAAAQAAIHLRQGAGRDLLEPVPDFGMAAGPSHAGSLPAVTHPHDSDHGVELGAKGSKNA